eukprot:1899629-Prymnesium_polylepis.1
MCRKPGLDLGECPVPLRASPPVWYYSASHTHIVLGSSARRVASSSGLPPPACVLSRAVR